MYSIIFHLNTVNRVSSPYKELSDCQFHLIRTELYKDQKLQVAADIEKLYAPYIALLIVLLKWKLAPDKPATIRGEHGTAIYSLVCDMCGGGTPKVDCIFIDKGDGDGEREVKGIEAKKLFQGQRLRRNRWGEIGVASLKSDLLPLENITFQVDEDESNSALEEIYCDLMSAFETYQKIRAEEMLKKWNVPSFDNQCFTGRKRIIHDISSLLQEHKIVLLSGPPGTGKTSIASEYIQRYGYRYKVVFWLSGQAGENKDNDIVTLNEIAKCLKASKTTFDPKNAIADFTTLLEKQKNVPWLGIFDNVSDLEVISRLFPDNCRRGDILLTGWLKSTGPLGVTIKVNPMESEDALSLLFRCAGKISETAKISDCTADDIRSGRDIIKALSGYPGAIVIVGTYVNEQGLSFSDFYKEYFLKEEKKFRNIETDNYPRSMLIGVSLAFEETQKRNPFTATILYCCSFFSEAPIPEEIPFRIVEDLCSEQKQDQSETPSKSRVLEIVNEACNYSLMTRNPELKTYSMHLLIQKSIQDLIEKKSTDPNKKPEREKAKWAELCIRVFSEVYAKLNFGNELLQDFLLPHSIYLYKLSKQFSLRSEQTANFYRHLAKYPHLNNTKRAAFLEESLAIYKHLFGKDHPYNVDVLYELSEINVLKENFEEANSLCQRALTINEIAFGKDHPKVAKSLFYLSRIHRNQNLYQKAEALDCRALTILEKHPGQDLEVADTLINLNHDYHGQNKYENTEALLLRALSLLEKHLGQDHRRVQMVLFDIEHVYHKQGKDKEAQTYKERAMDIHAFFDGHAFMKADALIDDYTSFGGRSWVDDKSWEEPGVLATNVLNLVVQRVQESIKSFEKREKYREANIIKRNLRKLETYAKRHPLKPMKFYARSPSSQLTQKITKLMKQSKYREAHIFARNLKEIVTYVEENPLNLASADLDTGKKKTTKTFKRKKRPNQDS